MIKVKAILTDKGTLKPEYIPETKFGNHSDTEYFYFFESDEDREIYINNIPKAEEIKPVHPVISAIKSMNEEEKQELINYLKIQTQ